MESDWGNVFVQQRWLTDTPEVSVDWIHLNMGIPFAVTIPLVKKMMTSMPSRLSIFGVILHWANAHPRRRGIHGC